MPVVIDDAIRADATLRPAVERAEKIFANVLGVAVGRVDRHWEPARDARGHPVARLHVTDEGVSGDILFTAEQLSDTASVGDRLLKFWGDLLEEKSHKLLARLREHVAALED